jgi:ribosomal protein S18 acetylase RimI-like enzyme
MVKKDLKSNLIKAYLKGIGLYAKAMPFDQDVRYQDDKQLDKFSHNFLLLSQNPIHPDTIQRYLDTTKAFGFSQFVTFSPVIQASIHSILLPYKPITESLMLMSAPMDVLLKNMQGHQPGVTVEYLSKRDRSSFLALNYAMDVTYGIDYAKGNGKRILEVLNENPDHAGYLLAKQKDQIVGQIGFHRFDEIGEIDEFYVLDAYQHQGIGKSMFLKTIQHLKQLGVNVVILVANQNDQAYTIYKKWGFSDVRSLFQLRVHIKP